MKLLLDTHAFLWCRQDSLRLGTAPRNAIAQADAVFVSVVSAWEVAIKVALGRLRLPERFEDAVIDSGFEPLPINFGHAEAVALLPRHHRDPFDRMLIAQATTERLTLVSHDHAFAAYGVPVVWI